MTTALTAREWHVTNAAYHADCDHIGHSMADVFIESAAEYHARFITKTILPKSPSSAMQIGSACHAMIFERDRYLDLVAVFNGASRRSKAWDEFEAANSHKTILLAEEAEVVARIVRAVLSHGDAMELIRAPGRNELGIQWEDAESGLPLKCKFDRLLDAGIILDLKTASDPSPLAWARDAHNYGYHRQAPWYIDGANALRSIGHELVYIVVGNEEPHDVAVRRLKQSAIDLGREQNRAALRGIRACTHSGVWQHSWNVGIGEVDLPRWAYSQ